MEFVYTSAGGLNAESLEELLAKLWRDLTSVDESRVRAKAESEGIVVDQLPRDLAEAYRVEQRGSGIDPATTALIVAIAPAVAPVLRKVLEDLWSKVLLPRVLRERGDDSLVSRDD